LQGGASGALEDLVIEDESNLVSRIIMSILLGLLAITVVVAGVFQYSWQHGLGGMPYPVQVWEKTLRLARWVKLRPLPHETPREIVRRLKRELPEVKDLDYLGESYIRSRYGQKPLTDNERERLEGVWKQSRNTLLQRLLRWRS
jgi:hypothetical protein